MHCLFSATLYCRRSVSKRNSSGSCQQGSPLYPVVRKCREIGGSTIPRWADSCLEPFCLACYSCSRFTEYGADETLKSTGECFLQRLDAESRECALSALDLILACGKLVLWQHHLLDTLPGNPLTFVNKVCCKSVGPLPIYLTNNCLPSSFRVHRKNQQVAGPSCLFELLGLSLKRHQQEASHVSLVLGCSAWPPSN